MLDINQKKCSIQPMTFKSRYVVKVAKKAFDNPENYRKCLSSFSNEMDKCTGDKLNGIFGTILAFFTTKPHKTGSHLVGSNFETVGDCLQKKGYSLAWFKSNTGLPIKDLSNQDYHTFEVCTKDDKSKYMTALKDSMKKIFSYAIEGCKKYPNDRELADAYATAKIGIEFENKIQGIPISGEFEIVSLDELKNVVEKMNY